MAWKFEKAGGGLTLSSGAFSMMIPEEEVQRLRSVQNIGQLNRFLMACAERDGARDALQGALNDPSQPTTDHLLQIIEAIPNER